MATLPWYASREDVMSALDVKVTAQNNGQVDRAIDASSRSIEDDLLYRRFYPELGTRYFDWPACLDPDIGRYRLNLGRSELVSATTVTISGTATTAYTLASEPGRQGAPYVELVFDEGVSGPGSPSDRFRAVAVTGVFDYRTDGVSAGALAAAIVSTSATSCTVTDSAKVGVGHLLLVGSERMVVTDKAMLDTGVNIAAPDSLTANLADTSITLSTLSGAPTVGETILVDSERMLVVDLAGSVATVKRAWDGSVLAAHPSGSDIYAPRTLTVERGALGTTAATHLISAAITRHRPPALVNQLCVAEALTTILQEVSGYGRVVGSGDNQREAAGKGIESLRRRAWIAHGRKAF